MRRKTKPLTELEWQTCWMSVRYAYGRNSISASMLPYRLLQGYYLRLTGEQKKILMDEIDKLALEYKEDKQDPNWIKFRAILDTERHIQIPVDGVEHTGFILGNKIFLVQDVIKNPYVDKYIPLPTLEELEKEEEEEKHEEKPKNVRRARV